MLKFVYRSVWAVSNPVGVLLWLTGDEMFNHEKESLLCGTWWMTIHLALALLPLQCHAGKVASASAC